MKKLKIISLGALILLGWGTTFVFANSDFPTGETCTRTRGRTETRSKCDSNGRKHTTYTPIKENREKRRFVHATHCSNLGTCNVYGIGSSINSMTIAYRGTRRFNCRTANVRKPTTKRTTVGCAIDGKCGGTNGVTTTSPRVGCNVGRVINNSGLRSNYTITWSCEGKYSGITANCYTKKIANGVCPSIGSLHGTSKPTPWCGKSPGGIGAISPTATDALSWSWKCNGINGGSSPTCSYIHDITGVCNYNGLETYSGRYISGNLDFTASNRCSNEQPTVINKVNPKTGNSASETDYKWTWQCKGYGAGINSGTCTVYKQIPGICNTGIGSVSTNRGCSNDGGNLSFSNGSASNIINDTVKNPATESTNHRATTVIGTWTCNEINGSDITNCEESPYLTYTNHDNGAVLDTDASSSADWNSITNCTNLTPWGDTADSNIKRAICDLTRTVDSNRRYNYGLSGIVTHTDNPTWPGNLKKINVDLELDINGNCSDGSTFGDNNDSCTFEFGITTEHHNVIVQNLTTQSVTGFDYTDIATDVTNLANKENVVLFTGYPYSITGGIGTYRLVIDQVKSYMPFLEELGKLTFDLGGSSLVFDNVAMKFSKPFVGSLHMTDPDEIILETWQDTTLEVVGSTIGTTNSNTNFNWHIESFTGTLEATNSNYQVELSGNTVYGIKENPSIETRIYLDINGQSGESGLATNPYITYPIGGSIIKYFLTPSNNAIGTEKIIKGEGELQGVKIVGLYQGGGKLYNSAQDENSSDITTVEYRNNIKRNAEILIRDINPGEIRGGVRYEEGDITINSSTDFSNIDTLIIKDGNLTIEGDIDTSKLLGLIVLGDYYTNPSIGNVFINPAVDYINAAIFADGGFISVWSEQSDTIGYTDNPTRTSDLQEQLVMKGTLITRNTIGGALDAGDGDYILPGGSTTTDFDQAMMYDLNYIRRGDSDPVGNASDLYGAYPFIVLYDSRIQSTPPPGFGEE